MRLLLIALLLPLFSFCQTQTVQLHGSGSDPENGPITFLWSQKSGPSGSIVVFDNPTLAEPFVHPKVGEFWKNGVYVFTLKVTDNQGAFALDDVSLTITIDMAPVVFAGNDATLQLPLTQITLTGTVTDPEGFSTITSIKWTLISGPNTPTITQAPNALTAVVSNLTNGVYKFRFRAADVGGASNSDTVQITITAANQPPSSNAGSDQVITLPQNSVVIGKLDPPNLTIQWVKMSGPTGSVIQYPNSSVTSVSNLKKGTYVFRKITRNAQGVSNSDDVTIIVKKNVGFVFGSET